MLSGSFLKFNILQMASDLVLLVISVVARVVSFRGKWFLDRPEISTPLNSWLRLTEGVHIYSKGTYIYILLLIVNILLFKFHSGLKPYDGVVFHETPLSLFIFNMLGCDPASLSWLFIIVDLLTGYILYRIGELVANQRLLSEDASYSAGQVHKESKSLLSSLSVSITLPKMLALAYLLNPLTISNCGAMTTTVWSNLLLAVYFYSLVSSAPVVGSVCLSVATYQTMYPALLMLPLTITQYQKTGQLRSVIGVITAFLITILGLQYLSYLIVGDWSYIHSVYGFILTVPELTPNMGIFWYFFTEMFDHFRLLFICTFQINLLLYVAPLSIKFPDQPLLLSTVIVGLIAVFKSYPGLGDVGFFLSLLPIFSNLLPFMKQTFIIICMLLASSVLAPCAWTLWIYNNSANANYYFAINLVYSAALIFLITDLLFGHVKREFHLKNGFSILEKEDPNGKKPVLHLQ